MTVDIDAEHSPAVPVIALIGGFLGAGKTTLLTQIADRLRKAGTQVAVITNDQGADLVDTASVRRSGANAAEVTNGCFCCRFDDLAAVIESVLVDFAPDVILAEAVGSCADLAATVIRPLQQQYHGRLRVAPLLVAVDPLRLVEFAEENLSAEAFELGWLMHTQLEEADVITLTKSDLNLDLDSAMNELRADYPHTLITSVSATTGDHLDELMESWLGSGSPITVATGRLDIDYLRYGRAEALMSWSDVRLELDAEQPFVVDDWLRRLLIAIDTKIADAGGLIGHVKATVTAADADSDTKDGCWTAKGSLVAPGRCSIDVPNTRHAVGAAALINARVGVPVAALTAIIDAGIASASTLGMRIRMVKRTEFAPSQPVPTHRVPA